MEDPESEQFVQIFLFVATIFCYFLLFIFISFAMYSCCMKKFLDSYRKRREERRLDRENRGEEETQCSRRNMAFGADVNLIVTSEKNKVTIVPRSSENKPPAESDKNDLSGNNNDANANSTTPPGANVIADNHFVDKKYYDIFKA